MEGYWMIRTWTAGPVGEKVKFFVPGAKPSRSARRLARDAKKLTENREHAERELARLINANFREGDLLVSLDYSEEALTGRLERRIRSGQGRHDNAHAGAREEQSGERTRLDDLRDCYGTEEDAEYLEALRQAAQAEAELYILRLHRAAKKQGVQLRYVLTTSNLDGETGETVRVHHHLLLGAEALDLLERDGKTPLIRSRWGRGGVDVKKLSAQPDYTPIAVYLLRQVRHTPDTKGWTASRGLLRPVPVDRVALSGAELRPPKGCALLYRSEYIAGASQYIRYILRARSSPADRGIATPAKRDRNDSEKK